ncbi:MAG: BatA domain-containing protein [Planctomycetota bacterium]
MGFYNIFMLIGLAAVAVPIVIHLLNRRRAKVVDWGAMQFLLGSAAARNRRVMIEDIFLMILRCLLVALIVLAMARPFLSKNPMIPWALVLPLLFASVICLAVAGAIWRQRRTRWILLGVAWGLLLIAGGAAASEQIFQQRIWPSPGGGKDVAIVIDGSDSMRVRSGRRRRSNFDRAVREAQQVVDACRPSDTVSILLAGARPREVLPGASSDRDAARAALDDLVADGANTAGMGSLDLSAALGAATDKLRAGRNTIKKVVLISDGQNVGWSVGQPEVWRQHARRLRRAGTPRHPQIIARTLPLPDDVSNATLEQVRFSRSTIGVGRAVEVALKVRNFGSATVPAGRVQLAVEGAPAQSRDLAAIQPKASQSATLSCTFDRPGAHVVTARFAGEDDLPTDNEAPRVVNVLDHIPVLVVANAAASAGGGRAVATALAPKPSDQRSEAAPDAPPDARSAFAVETCSARRLAERDDLGRYRLVVLSNVPALPDEPARRLAEYVTEGGALLIAAGADADPEFYNHWRAPRGAHTGGRMAARLTPARLARERRIPPEPVGLAPQTLTLPGLRRLIAAGDSEAETVTVSAYRRLLPFDEGAPEVHGLLSNGDTVLACCRPGRGVVLMLPTAFDGDETNWRRTYFFVPFLHECAYHLTETSGTDWNVPAGSEVALRLPPGTSEATAARIRVVKLRSGADAGDRPVGATMPVDVESDETSGDARRVTFSRTAEPGLYRFRLPADLAGRIDGARPGAEGIPFVVRRDPRESNLAPLLAADFDKIAAALGAGGVRFDRAASVEELTALTAGDIPGAPLWQYFALGALAALIGEIALTRWIAAQRRAHTAEPVAFGTDTEDTRSYRARMRRMVAAAHEPRRSAESA